VAERESMRMKRRAVSLEESILVGAVLHVNCVPSVVLYRGHRDDTT
jgi:hypothetical protein